MVLNSLTTRWPAAERIAVMGGEKANRVVPPVIAQAPFCQTVVVDELVDGHQLDGSDAEALEMLDDRRVRHPGVSAPMCRRDLGMAQVRPRTWVS